MSDKHLPRQVLFAQLTHGMRTCGAQRKRFKDTTKHYMKKGLIYINTWEHMAANRSLWRHSTHQAMAKFHTTLLIHEAEKRHRRKWREMSQHRHVSHLLPTLKQDLQLKNQALESPQYMVKMPASTVLYSISYSDLCVLFLFRCSLRSTFHDHAKLLYPRSLHLLPKQTYVTFTKLVVHYRFKVGSLYCL